MADTNMNKNQGDKSQSNETMQREQAKASVAGGRTPEHSKSDDDRREQGRIDKEGREGREQGREKSAIGGGEKGQGMGQSSGQTSGQSSQGSQTGEPGRSRSELGENRESDKGREFDKNRSEPTSR